MEKRKNEKKNNKKVFLIVALLMALALVCYTGASTYAKYVSSANVPSQQATVAKWGVVVTAEASDLFANQYNDGVKVASDADSVDVKGNGDKIVVAPGTSGEMTLTISGQPEVNYSVDFSYTDADAVDIKLVYNTVNVYEDLSADDVSLTDGVLSVGTSLTYNEAEEAGAGVSETTYTAVDASGNPVVVVVTEDSVSVTTTNTYLPIVWTLNGEIYTSIADMFAFIDSDVSGVHATNTQISKSYNISWSWAFSTDVANDALDTILADIVADANSHAGEYVEAVTQMGFAFSVSVEQTQEQPATE